MFSIQSTTVSQCPAKVWKQFEFVVTTPNCCCLLYEKHWETSAIINLTKELPQNTTVIQSEHAEQYSKSSKGLPESMFTIKPTNPSEMVDWPWKFRFPKHVYSRCPTRPASRGFQPQSVFPEGTWKPNKTIWALTFNFFEFEWIHPEEISNCDIWRISPG